MFLHDASVGYGDAGDDTLTGFDTSTLYGGAREDDIFIHDAATGYGDDGADTLTGDGTGAQLYGGAGVDVLTATGDNLHLDGGDDVDFLYGEGNDIALAGGEGDDHLDATGADIVLHGGAGNDWVEGYGLNIAVYGDGGNDHVTGGPGAQVFGGQGDDKLQVYDWADAYGGAGNDLFIVGPNDLGDDNVPSDEVNLLNGGSGEDVFAVSLGDDNLITTIADFHAGTDLLAVDRTEFATNELTGQQTNYAFDHATTRVAADGSYTDVILHWAEVDGSGTTASFVRLQGVSNFDTDLIQVIDNYDTLNSANDIPRVAA